jgi:hypothetical protein
VTGSRLELRDSNDSSVANTLAAMDNDANPVKKYEAKSGNAGFAKFRKEAAAKAAATKADDAASAADSKTAEGAAAGAGNKKSSAKDGDEI